MYYHEPLPIPFSSHSREAQPMERSTRQCSYSDDLRDEWDEIEWDESSVGLKPGGVPKTMSSSEQFTSLHICTQASIMIQPTILLAIAMAIAGYCSVLCATPPNTSPDQEDRHQNDRLSVVAGKFPIIARRITIAAAIYQALLTAFSPYSDRGGRMCPRPQHLNGDLFTWNAVTSTSLLLIYAGAFMRVSAYAGLGKSFTFHLVEPDHLITTGVYKWVQHPSYTGAGLALIGVFSLFLRWDSVAACWIPDAMFSRLQGWGPGTVVVLLGVIFWAIWMRVIDEERMLKQTFHREWEDWHRTTKRFIPGLL
ncbi:unnamed protein product [Penicillium olsonii]|uniref:Protein-S-isoprenylcysteine O-methyltransferase n=1 Tax=Penicillium olsonii TaxID=99116 RepID=A0A9W4H9V8_PENOL|nr:unnamed protein product [Penicillium olsonii]CAG8264017.1 unnamed protein product [Penicillium olsonii]